MAEPTPAGRLHHIDGLRGVAALLVVIFHAIEFSPARPALMDAIGPVAQVWPQLGAAGVGIFFLLSGFVLVRSLDRGTTTPGRFVARRQLRLDPAYWVAVAVSLLMVMAQSVVPGLTGGSYSPLDVLVNLVYLQGILERPFILSVSWTLCLEVQLYLTLLAVFVLARRTSHGSRVVPVILASTGLAAVVLTAVVGQGMRFVWGPWPLFCVGALLFAGREDRRWNWAAGALLVASWIARGPNDPFEHVALAVAFVALLGWPPLTRVLSTRSLDWLGLRSYSLYLFHLFAIDVTTRIIYKITPALGVSMVTSLASIGVSIVVAAIVFRFVERPSLRLAEAAKTANLADLLRWRRARPALD